jgi:hypothetical protein
MRISIIFALLLFALPFTATATHAVVYVDCNAPGPTHDGTSWDTAFLKIQEGVNAATPGGEVWVADGTYVENVVMGEGVQLYGGFLGAEPGGYETSLDQRDFKNHIATVDGNQSGSCVVMAVDARVDGLTLTDGSGTTVGLSTHGGGIYCTNLLESGVIANNHVVHCRADWGGGISCTHDSAPAISSNTVEDSESLAPHGCGGGLYIQDSSPRISGNSIRGNKAWYYTGFGGGIYCFAASPIISGNIITANEASHGGGLFCDAQCCAIVEGNYLSDNHAPNGGGITCRGSSPTVIDNVITSNTAAWGGGITASSYSSPVFTNNIIVGNTALEWGGGVWAAEASPVFTGNTIAANSAARHGGGFYCWSDSVATIANNLVVNNTAGESAGGVFADGSSALFLFHNDFWGNAPQDYSGCEPGEGDISADPMFVDPENSNWHLSFGSPCIDAGSNDAPGLPETDWDGEDRIANGIVDIGADEYLTIYTEAPNPQPGCGGPLFGGSQNGFPAWVWFSIPLTPDCVVGSGCTDPNKLLGFECAGKLWYWDKYGKWAQVYLPPFVKWDLAVGSSYLLRLTEPVAKPSYEGLSPFIPWSFAFKLGKTGWTWVGMPGLTELTGDDFMDSIRVKYPSDDTGTYRTAQQDYDLIPDNWVSWGWAFFDTYMQAPKTFTPYLPFGHRTCYPWIGYRVWLKVGTDTNEDDPDQVTLLWPKSQ